MANKKDLRGGLEKMREVAELLNAWADDLESSLEKKNTKKAAAAAAGAAPAPAAPPSLEEVRGLLAEKSAAGYREQVVSLIRSYGVEKLSEVDPSHYSDLMAAAAGLGGDADA